MSKAKDLEETFIYYRRYSTLLYEFIQDNFTQAEILRAVDKDCGAFETWLDDSGYCDWNCERGDCSYCETVQDLEEEIEDMKDEKPEYKNDDMEKAMHGGEWDLADFINHLSVHDIDEINKNGSIKIIRERDKYNEVKKP